MYPLRAPERSGALPLTGRRPHFLRAPAASVRRSDLECQRQGPDHVLPSVQAKGLVMQIDWNSVFLPSLGIAEIVIRGTLMYLGLFAILRFMGRRQAGQFGPADLLVIVLIADAAQNGLGKVSVHDRRSRLGDDHRGLGVFYRLANLPVSGA
jgi:hypothetical protein